MNHIRSAYVVADDPRTLIPFYSAVLGVAPSLIDETRWVQFPKETGRLALSSPEEAAVPGVTSVIVLEVADLDAAHTLVLEHGGKVLGVRDMGGHGRTLSLTDPAGNVIQLFEAVPA